MKNTTVVWSGQGLHFKGHGPNDQTVDIDGRTEKGISPMVLLLHGLAGCAAIDVVVILEKMRFGIASLEVEVEAIREEGQGARKWERIHLRFLLSGDIPLEKAQRSVDLSVEKYCSAHKQLQPTAEITTELILNP